MVTQTRSSCRPMRYQTVTKTKKPERVGLEDRVRATLAQKLLQSDLNPARLHSRTVGLHLFGLLQLNLIGRHAHLL